MKSRQKQTQDFLGMLWPGPTIFRNTKDIPKNTKENRYRFCFGHNFFNNAAINLNP